MERSKSNNTPIEISPSENLEPEPFIGVKPYRELCWVNKLLEEMCVKVKTPIIKHEDNQLCILTITGEWGQKRLCHMDIRYKYIKCCVEHGFIAVNYINSENQEADLFTKPLPLIRYRM
jgi:hypothetical protein